MPFESAQNCCLLPLKPKPRVYYFLTQPASLPQRNFCVLPSCVAHAANHVLALLHGPPYCRQRAPPTTVCPFLRCCVRLSPAQKQKKRPKAKASPAVVLWHPSLISPLTEDSISLSVKAGVENPWKLPYTLPYPSRRGNPPPPPECYSSRLAP